MIVRNRIIIEDGTISTNCGYALSAALCTRAFGLSVVRIRFVPALRLGVASERLSLHAGDR